MRFRTEEIRDRSAVHRLNIAAFGSPAEADLIDALRDQAGPVISLVAEEDGVIVGHIFFSPVTLDGHTGLQLMGLAPMAVAPERQRTGIGSALVRAGLDACRAQGIGAVVVLGHADYYPRFGFLPASRFSIRSEYDVPEGVFMIQELTPGYLRGASGVVRYHAAFSSVT